MLHKQFSFLSPNPVKVSTFEELRSSTLLYFLIDKVMWKCRPVTTFCSAYGIKCEVTMPKTRASDYSSNWNFIDLRLSKADEARFVEWFSKNEQNIPDLLHRVNTDAYKFSISYDFDNDCFIATLSGTRHASINKNSTISGRSAEWLEAIGLVLFKHMVMCEEKEWSDYTRPTNWG